jgi:hypothetical protein
MLESAMPMAPPIAAAPPPPGTGALEASTSINSLQDWSIIDAMFQIPPYPYGLLFQ